METLWLWGPTCPRLSLGGVWGHNLRMPHLGSYRDQEPLGSGHLPQWAPVRIPWEWERAQAIKHCAITVGPLLPSFCCSHPSSAQYLLCTPTSASPRHKRSDWPRKGRADWHIKWWHFVTDWSGLQQSACQWALHFFPQANVTLKLNRIFFHPTCCFLCHILF